MDYKNLATPRLIEKCVDRDPLAWAEFVARFSELIEFAVKKTLGRPLGEACEDAKDIRQDILTSVWGKNRLAEVRNRQRINYWLVIVARNTTVNYLRANNKYALSADMSYFEGISEEAPGSYDAEASPDPADKIREICGALDPREKLIFKLHFKKGLSVRELAGMLKVPAGTAAAAIARMRKKIQKMGNG
jgi:RNA polymerase sigma-70 factor (ECF subfamily)